MFNPTKPIPINKEHIDKIIKIKKQIAKDLANFHGDKEKEWYRLFELYVSKDDDLSKINNI